jgi:coenzyme F420-reducing hydrogenase beta subunit
MNELLSPKDIVSSGLCIGCGSCVAQSPSSNASMQWDKQGFLKPSGDATWYRKKSEAFTKTCPFSPKSKNEDFFAAQLFPDAKDRMATIGSFQKAYVGHVEEEDFRLQGSSGGMVTWVATELMRKGLIDGVAHVVAVDNPQEKGRYFQYRISRTEADIREGAKSRYYPIEMSQVLNTIREVPGRYAVIGIPCFIKAINLLRKEDTLFRDRIQYTLGLFCGHMKSARFVESFAWQIGVPVDKIQKVEYRYKDPNRPANWYNAMLTLKDGRAVNRDWWHLNDGDWGAGYFMNSACNYCDDVVAETADVAFGDAWVEPYSSDGRGTNVVISRSSFMQNMIDAAIDEGRLNLTEVDGKFVEQTQAAGFRQRREGLAYRLSWSKSGVKPCKRVAPDAISPAKQRKLIYRMRYFITKWSNRTFAWARQFHKPQIYLQFARTATAVYHSLAYHGGKWSEMKKRFGELKR